jgi:serine/threonine-protein kinase HipA
MMEQCTLVYIDLNGTPIKTGWLWTRFQNGRETASFEYDHEWLRHPKRISLDPALQLVEGPFHTSADKPLFGAIDDSAPDRWGRLLIRRSLRKSRKTFKEVDFLLTVDDETRQGALRFKADEDGPFLTTYEKSRVPPLPSLGRLLSAATHVLQDKESAEDLKLLLAPGSSLGGARPKASVRDRDGHLMIAKFPRKEDEMNLIAWEAVALTLAKKAGIEVPTWRLESIGQRSVLLSRRFDREKNRRIPFLSTLSLLQAKDNEMHSYLEIADEIRKISRNPHADLKALWRRIVFNVLISNVDDHLRNHALLYDEVAGWRLSPAYDLNPTPTDIKPRILSTAIDLSDQTASLELTLSVASHFELGSREAKKITKEVAESTRSWRKTATSFKIKKREIDRMSSAFEHTDLEMVLRS